MKGLTCWLACVLGLQAGVAGADARASVIWQGTLGTQRIVVEQSSDMAEESDCGGRYFYERHRRDIRLEGKPGPQGACTMQEWPSRSEQRAVKPEWRMRLPSDGRWQGE